MALNRKFVQLTLSGNGRLFLNVMGLAKREFGTSSHLPTRMIERIEKALALVDIFLGALDEAGLVIA